MARSTGFFALANHASKLAGAGARPVVLTSHLTVRAAWATAKSGSSLIIACVGERRDADAVTASRFLLKREVRPSSNMVIW